ncbi:MAG: diacylglycerol kinase family lipid kinase [Stomatobaculum sp.]|nr:diacylglycerol kinase family lipid kinase [Stomatobaculum sp.]
MLYFIVNPNAGGVNGYRVWKRLERRLIRKKTEYQVILTGGRGEARLIAAQLTDQTDSAASDEEIVLVGVGGDGTMNEIVDGVHISEKLILGYIPVGGGSDLARGLHLPHRPGACLDRILASGEVRKIDYGVLNYGTEVPRHRRFLVSAGCGFAAGFTELLRVQHEEGRFSGIPVVRSAAEKAAYLNCLLNMKTVRGNLILDESRRIELNHIFLMSALIQPTENGRRLAPGSSSADGLLAVSVLHNASRIRQMGTLTAAGFRITPGDAGVRMYSCQEVKVVLEEAMPLHADGETCGMQAEFSMRCVKQKLNIIC